MPYLVVKPNEVVIVDHEVPYPGGLPDTYIVLRLDCWTTAYDNIHGSYSSIHLVVDKYIGGMWANVRRVYRWADV